MPSYFCSYSPSKLGNKPTSRGCKVWNKRGGKAGPTFFKSPTWYTAASVLRKEKKQIVCLRWPALIGQVSEDSVGRIICLGRDSRKVDIEKIDKGKKCAMEEGDRSGNTGDEDDRDRDEEDEGQEEVNYLLPNKQLIHNQLISSMVKR